MNRLITVAVLMTIVVAICIVGYCVVSGLGDSVGPLLEQADYAASTGDIEAARELSCKAEEEFVKREKWVSIFIYHELVEELGVQLSALPDFAEEESQEEFLSAINSAIVMLGHVVSDEKPSFSNIF